MVILEEAKDDYHQIPFKFRVFEPFVQSTFRKDPLIHIVVIIMVIIMVIIIFIIMVIIKVIIMVIIVVIIVVIIMVITTNRWLSSDSFQVLNLQKPSLHWPPVSSIILKRAHRHPCDLR